MAGGWAAALPRKQALVAVKEPVGLPSEPANLLEGLDTRSPSSGLLGGKGHFLALGSGAAPCSTLPLQGRH